MNLRMTAEALQQQIMKAGARSRECTQVAKRLKELLPQTLRLVRHRYVKSGRKVAAAERLAMNDPEYQQAIENYLKLRADALHARVQFDTHRMLRQARQSIRRYHL